MSEIADRRPFGKGDVIFREGSTGDLFYLIEKGTVEISRTGPSGDKVVLGRIGPGGIFGEMAIIDNKPRMATATAFEPCVCHVIPRSLLDKKLASSDRLVQTIVKILIENIRSITALEIRKTTASG